MIANQMQHVENAAEARPEFDQAMLRTLNEDLGGAAYAFLLGACVEDIRVRLASLPSLPRETRGPASLNAVLYQLSGLFLQFGASAAALDVETAQAASSGNLAAALDKVQESGRRALAHFKRLHSEATA